MPVGMVAYNTEQSHTLLMSNLRKCPLVRINPVIAVSLRHYTCHLLFPIRVSLSLFGRSQGRRRRAEAHRSMQTLCPGFGARAALGSHSSVALSSVRVQLLYYAVVKVPIVRVCDLHTRVDPVFKW